MQQLNSDKGGIQSKAKIVNPDTRMTISSIKCEDAIQDKSSHMYQSKMHMMQNQQLALLLTNDCDDDDKEQFQFFINNIKGGSKASGDSQLKSSFQSEKSE